MLSWVPVGAICCRRGGGGGGEGVNHFPEKKHLHLQVAQIFMKQSKRNRGHTIN